MRPVRVCDTRSSSPRTEAARVASRLLFGLCGLEPALGFGLLGQQVALGQQGLACLGVFRVFADLPEPGVQGLPVEQVRQDHGSDLFLYIRC